MEKNVLNASGLRSGKHVTEKMKNYAKPIQLLKLHLSFIYGNTKKADFNKNAMTPVNKNISLNQTSKLKQILSLLN